MKPLGQSFQRTSEVCTLGLTFDTSVAAGTSTASSRVSPAGIADAFAKGLTAKILPSGPTSET